MKTFEIVYDNVQSCETETFVMVVENVQACEIMKIFPDTFK